MPRSTDGKRGGIRLPSASDLHTRHATLQETDVDTYSVVTTEDAIISTKNNGSGDGYDLVTGPAGTLFIVLDHESEHSTEEREEMFKGVPESVMSLLQYSQFALLSDGSVFASNVWWCTANSEWHRAYGPPLDDRGQWVIRPLLNLWTPLRSASW